MAITKIADILSQVMFQKRALAESLRKSALYETGAMVADRELEALCKNNAGETFTFDYFNDLADDASNVGSDDETTNATPNKIGATKETAIKLMRNQGWGSARITASLSAVGNPMDAIVSRISAYWGRQYDIVAIAIVNGVIADNVANDASDMVNDISAVSLGGVAGFNDVVDTKLTMGDRSDELVTMVCHSAVAGIFLKDQVTNKVFDADGNLLYEELAGLKVIISDSVYNNAGVYDSYIFGSGAIAFGFGQPDVQEEEENTASAGNGQGVATTWSRRDFSIHPKGFKYTGTSKPTNAVLDDATSWDRVVERKRVKFAVLRSKLVANVA